MVGTKDPKQHNHKEEEVAAEVSTRTTEVAVVEAISAAGEAATAVASLTDLKSRFQTRNLEANVL